MPKHNTAWPPGDEAVFDDLTTPGKIQHFLDHIPYSTDPIYRCPARVVRDSRAHCFDGALFAAAALRRIGHRPLIIDLLAERDDDHLLALYRNDDCWGAVAKSNFAGLRFREPIHRSLRELVMTYFEPYYNVAGEKTLRGYTIPLNLGRFDRLGWEVNDAPLDGIADRLDEIRRIALLAPNQVQRLQRVDERSYQAGLLGADAAGLYQPQ